MLLSCVDLSRENWLTFLLSCAQYLAQHIFSLRWQIERKMQNERASENMKTIALFFFHVSERMEWLKVRKKVAHFST